MKTTMFMAISANGYVARRNWDEDFLPYEWWLHMLDKIKIYGHLIWWNSTYKAVKQRWDKYLDDLKDIPVIIVSKDKTLSYFGNVTVCHSPSEALEMVWKMGFEKWFLSWWPTLNSAFAKKWLIDEIILNYNSTILSGWIHLFAENNFELQLELAEINRFPKDIVQMRYLVKNVLTDKSAF